MKELNLIPYNMKEEKIKRSKYQSYIIYLLLIIVILAAGIIVPSTNLSNLQSQEIQLQKQVQNSKTSISDNATIQKELSDLKNYTDKVDFLTKSKVSTSDRLEALEQNVPSDVVFTELNYTETGIKIKATASYYNSICEMSAQLETSKNYTKSEINEISYDDTKSLYTFSITLEY
jgi:type IV pilus assembly protein PilN